MEAVGWFESIDTCVPKFAALKPEKNETLWDDVPNSRQMAYEMQPYCLIGKLGGTPSVAKPRPARADDTEIQGDQKFSVHLMITVQKHAKIFLTMSITYHDNVVRIGDNR
jgi:hypothetical protein